MRWPCSQGKRTLNRWYAKDLREVVDVSSGNTAMHGDAVLVGLLFEQLLEASFDKFGSGVSWGLTNGHRIKATVNDLLWGCQSKG